MTNAVLEKRVARLEAEVRSLKSSVLPTGKRLLVAIRESEEDVRRGRVYRGDLRKLLKRGK